MRQVIKPPALRPGSSIIVVAPASPVDKSRLDAGLGELARLGYDCRCSSNVLSREGYFAGPVEVRLSELVAALAGADYGGVCFARGGYGTNYLTERLDPRLFRYPKVVIGYSDVTSLQIFLWQELGWVTFYGPMVAAGLDVGASVAGGYEGESFTRAMAETRSGWLLELQGDSMVVGEGEGVILGGCLTLVEATLATPWELDTDGAVLLLEDRAMKPYQVDRALMHLKQAGKFEELRGVILGEFPDSEPAEGSDVTVEQVCRRILGDCGVPVVWRAAIGHTNRPMLTIPLGVRARLRAGDRPQLKILEPAVLA